MRCDHPEVTMTEEVFAAQYHEFVNGHLDHSYKSDNGTAHTGVIRVECKQCGYDKRFGAHSKWPCWVAALWEDMICRDEDE